MSERWPAVALSVLLHAALLAALLYGWLVYRRPPRLTPTLAIEATVVDARTLAVGAARAPRVPPPPAPSVPPPPTAAEIAQRDQERAAQAEEARRAAQAATEAQRQADEQAAAQREAAQREATEREAARKAELEAENRRRAQEEARQHAAEEQQRREDEAALRRSLAREEQAAAARAGPALASWQAAIASRITRAWIRPPTARPGIECKLAVTQVPGGEVTNVRILGCNGDQAVRESIEAAVYRASPLPPPPDPALFDRNLIINFKPD